MKQASVILAIWLILMLLHLCFYYFKKIILFQKYFKNGGKSMSFKIDDDNVHIKYTQI